MDFIRGIQYYTLIFRYYYIDTGNKHYRGYRTYTRYDVVRHPLSISTKNYRSLRSVINQVNKITIQNVSKIKSLPSKKQFKIWVDQALSGYKKNYEIVIRFVDTKEITKLNKRYRKKNKPTNILSFQFDPPPRIKTNFLGDLVICIPLVKKEAKIQRKAINFHLAHLVIHGVLHLIGYNHKTKKQALEMESLEIKHLKKLGFTNPY